MGYRLDTEETFKGYSLSTGHMPCEAPDFGELLCATHEFGYVVRIPDEQTFNEVYADTTPDWIRPIIALAHEHKISAIEFDRDVPEDDQLPIYDW